MKHNKTHFFGVTMIELLVVVAIMGLLIVTMTVGIRTYLARSSDAQRKSDIKKISQALEQYYNDHNGYPVSLAVGAGPTCGSSTILTPYMKQVPCDPNRGTTRPYLYLPQGSPYTGSRGEQVYRGYRLLVSLEYTADPQIAELGCPKAAGCGGGAPAVYNFGLATNAQVNMTP